MHTGNRLVPGRQSAATTTASLSHVMPHPHLLPAKFLLQIYTDLKNGSGGSKNPENSYA